VTFLVTICVFVAWAYWLTHGHSWKPGSVGALVLTGFGAFAALDGITLATQEYARTRDTRIVQGVVVEKSNSSDAEKERTWSRRRRMRRRLGQLLTDGSTPHDVVGRLVLTGSPTAWIIEYRYPCGGPYHCRSKDFVPEALWRRLPVGEPVAIRQAGNDTATTRIAENPATAEAIVHLAFAMALMLGAGLVSGRFTERRRQYVTAPAIVTAVEPVKYLGVTRWRIRFAYLDPQGTRQESADEVRTPGWKPGDDCIAVFTTEQPDLATLQPLKAA
jgi:hypothetical protein